MVPPVSVSRAVSHSSIVHHHNHPQLSNWKNSNCPRSGDPFQFPAVELQPLRRALIEELKPFPNRVTFKSCSEGVSFLASFLLIRIFLIHLSSFPSPANIEEDKQTFSKPISHSEMPHPSNPQSSQINSKHVLVLPKDQQRQCRGWFGSMADPQQPILVVAFNMIRQFVLF